MWTEFCDWYIELAKPVLYGEDEKAKGIALNVLNTVLKTGLQLLHPAMPYITEEIYCNLPGVSESITISSWPEFSEELESLESEDHMNYVIEAIKALRNVRAEMNVPPSRKAKVVIHTTEGREAFEKGRTYFEKLASASEVEFIETKEEATDNMVSTITKGAELFMPLLDLVDIEKELERLNKEKEKLEKEIDRVEKKLSNERFISKAPEAVVNEEKEKGEKYKEMFDSVVERINSLK
jgi:valyl-tRNA synthetase